MCGYDVYTKCIVKLARQNRFPSFRGELFLFSCLFEMETFSFGGTERIRKAQLPYRTVRQ